MWSNWPFLSSSEVPRSRSLIAIPLMKTKSSLVGCFSNFPSLFSAMVALNHTGSRADFMHLFSRRHPPCHTGSLKLAMVGLFTPIYTAEIGKCYKLIFLFYFSKNRFINTSLQVIFWNGFLFKRTPGWSPFAKSKSVDKNQTLVSPSVKI